MKKISRRIESSCSPYSAPKTSRNLKKLAKNQKINDAREDAIEIVAFRASAIKSEDRN